MEVKSASEIRLQDPLSAVARKERRSLLVASALGIIMVKTGLVPSKISGFGVEFTQTNQKTFLVIFGLIVLYFLVSFLIYAVSDFLAWRIAFNRKRHEILKEQEIEPDKYKANEVFEWLDKRLHFLAKLSRPTSVIRTILEFGFPIVVGIYSFLELICY